MESEVVTLSNGKEYELLLEQEYNNKIFYLAELIGDDNINGDSFFFEKTIRDGEEYLKIVTDKNLIEQLLVLFAGDYIRITNEIGGIK